MSLFDRLAWLAGSRSSRRQKGQRPTRFGRRPLGEMLEQRRVLSANPIGDNACAPAVDLSGLGTLAAPFEYAVGTAGGIQLDMATDARVSVVDFESDGTTPTGDTIRWQSDPDIGEDFPAGDALLGADGTFTWTPEALEASETPYRVQIIAWDQGSPQRAGFGTFFVLVQNPNTQPEIGAPIADETVQATTELKFTATATDADGDNLTFSLPDAETANGANATDPVIDPATGEFTWTPDTPGTYTFTVRVTDDGAGTLMDETTVEVTVVEFNVAPNLEIEGGNSRSLTAGETLSVVVTASDVNLGDTLFFSVDDTSFAKGVTITPDGADPRKALVEWTTDDPDVVGSPHTIRIEVGDGALVSLGDSDNLTVTVNERPVAPEVTAVTGATPAAPQTDPVSFTATVVAGSTLDLPVVATDANGDPITYSVTNPPLSGNPEATIGADSGAFSWEPTVVGTYTFSITVEDDTDPTALESTAELIVTVTEAPAAPTLAAIADRTVGPNGTEEQMVDLVGADVNAGDTLLYSDEYSPAIATVNVPVITVNADQTATFSWTPVAADFGGSDSIEVTVTVDDQVAGTANAVRSFTFTLDDVGPSVVGVPLVTEEATLTRIQLTFDEPLDVGSSVLLANAMLMLQGNNPTISFSSVLVGGNTATFSTAEALAPGTYSFTLSKDGIVDQFGNEMATGYFHPITIS